VVDFGKSLFVRLYYISGEIDTFSEKINKDEKRLELSEIIG